MRILLFLLIALGLLAIFISVYRQSEPAWGGMSLRKYLYDLNPHVSTPEERAIAIEAIRQIGTNGVPVLMAELSARNGLLRSRSERRHAAIAGFRVLGQQARFAIPLLENAIKDPGTTIDAATVLSGFGPEGALVLSQALTNQNENVRSTVIDLLAHMNTNANVAAAALLACIDSANKAIAYKAAGALESIAADQAVVIPSLVNNLKSSNPVCRGASAYALGFFDCRTAETIQSLEKLASDSDRDVASSVSNALLRLGRKHNPPIP